MLSSLVYFSGDTDSVVPVTATRYSIDALKLPTLLKWYPWYDNKKVSREKQHYHSFRVYCKIGPKGNLSQKWSFYMYLNCKLIPTRISLLGVLIASLPFITSIQRRLVDGAKYTKD